ncbi:Nicastrin [Cooperia oncophora]
MMKGEFPRKLSSKFKAQLDPVLSSQLEAIIEVQQLGTGDGVKLYGHADGGQFQRGELKEVLDSLSAGAIAAGGSLVPPTESSRMPPSSWHPFFRIASSIRGIVLAPFREKYEYRRINSMLDRAQWNSTQRSAAISEVTIAASALLRAAGDHVRLDNGQKMALQVDKEFITTLFECFIDSPDWFSCDFFKRLNGDRLKPSSGESYF